MGDEPKLEIGKDLLTLSEVARKLAESRLAHQDWSGLPLPVHGLQLVLEPRYKLQGISKFRWQECYDENGERIPLSEEAPQCPSSYRRVNSWWSDRLKATINVFHDANGRALGGFELDRGLWFALRTLQAADVWPVEAELKAQKKLSSLISDYWFGIYTLTGCFIEVSSRSQVTYLFRRGRPTIAMREHDDYYLPLCALCVKPIGYDGQNWAGVMSPTDEVIAHLLMMRGSDEKLCANANQHPIEHPAAGA